MLLEDIIFSPALQLGIVNRYSGVYLTKPESVADHTYQVSIIAIWIANLINESNKELDIPDVVDISRVALKAVVHDIDECQTCDIPRNVKYFNPDLRDHLHDVSDRSVYLLADQLDFKLLYDEWAYSKDSTIEGLIVKLADMLHVVKKLIEEISFLHNLYMLKVSLEIKGHLFSVIKAVENMNISITSKKVFRNLISDGLRLVDDINDQHKDFIDQYKINNHLLPGNIKL